MVSETNACNCIDPQNGQPRCPCMMSRRKEDKSQAFTWPQTSCSKCGLKFTDSMGRPIVMGYACTRVDCPCGLGGVSCSVSESKEEHF